MCRIYLLPQGCRPSEALRPGFGIWGLRFRLWVGESSMILYCSILYLYYTILYYTILYYTILYYTILYYTILYYTILYYTILYYTILYCTILCYTTPAPFPMVILWTLVVGPFDSGGSVVWAPTFFWYTVCIWRLPRAQRKALGILTVAPMRFRGQTTSPCFVFQDPVVSSGGASASQHMYVCVCICIYTLILYIQM